MSQVIEYKDLPDMWEVRTLGTLCDVLDNKRIPITKKDRKSGKYPYYGATGILDYVDGYIFDEKLILIGEDGAKWGAGDNSAFTVKGKCWVNNHAHVIRPHRNIIVDNWIIYFLNGNDLSSYITGLTVPKLNQGKMNGIPIPLPPLAEQKRIVTILDEAFAGISQAVANAEKNLANARELFESYLTNIFTKKEEGWIEKSLGEVCDLFQGLCINKKTKHLLVEHSNLPLLRIKDLKRNTEEQYIAEFGYPIKALVTEEDLIYTRTGSLGLVFRGRKGVLHNNSFKIVPNNLIDRSFLYWWLQETSFNKNICKLAEKAAQPDITHAIFKVQMISFPPIEVQKDNVSLIERMNKESQKLESIYKQKLAVLTELKQSILQKAFSGELTTEDIPKQVNG